MNSIYALCEPGDGAIRYVGKTAARLKDRLRGHLNDAARKGDGIPRFAWINALRARGEIPRIVLLESVGDDWQLAEKAWIAKSRAAGCKLLNRTNGGDGATGYRHSAAAIAAIREKASRRYTDDACRKMTGDAVRNAYIDPDARARLGAAVKAALAKPETRARLCAAQLISKGRPEQRAASSRAHAGKVVSAETRAKLSESRRGKSLPADVVARIAAGHVGLRHSAETREKMRAAALRRYASRSDR